MEDRTIRRETDADIADIHALVTAAFAGTAQADGREAEIVDALRDDDSLSLSLVAVQGARILGHLAASPVRIGDGTGGWFGVRPVSVDPEHRNLGWGGALVERALASLHAGGAGGVVVLGEPGFHARFGFERIDGLTCPGAPAEEVLARRLNDSQFPRGPVTCHPAFGQ